MYIKAVFFDAGGTLFRVRESVGFHYSRYAKNFGLSIDGDLLDCRFAEIFSKQPPLVYPRGASLPTMAELVVWEQDWWRTLLEEVFREARPMPFDDFFCEVYRYFSSVTAWQLFSEAISVLDRLKQMGYALAIVSNFDSRLLSICEGLGIAHFFDTIVFSSLAGVAKPEVGIFKIALAKMGRSAAEVLYIGDNPRDDLPAPHEMGMTALLIDREEQHKSHTPRITTLDALFEHIQ